LLVYLAFSLLTNTCSMKAATVNELKQELLNVPPAKLTELCLRLARFKKENKELLTYLLFEAHDTAAYIESVKQAMGEQFAEINKSNVYFVKKSLRKILRTANKYIRYSGLANVEVELLIYFCSGMKDLGISLEKNQVLSNIYLNQLKKIDKALATLHEDLQYDYKGDIEKLVNSPTA
jgi:hypothetical protein